MTRETILKAIAATLANDEVSTDEELLNHFTSEFELSREEAMFYLAQREDAAFGADPSWTIRPYEDQRAIRKAGPFYVAAYHQQQRYGGPAEGGWWYDAGKLVRVLKMFRHEERAYEYARRLNGRLHDGRKGAGFGPNAGRREYTSVLSDGMVVAEVCYETPAEHYPAERPHYC